MGLDFTNIADNAGAAFYVIHSGCVHETNKYESLKRQLEQIENVQCVILDVKSPDGEKVRKFYGFMAQQLPIAFIVRDDDTLYMQWTGTNEIPTNPTDIAFQLRQVGGV